MTDFGSLKDHVIVITGAGQGIGRAFAKAFALAGATAVIAELNARKATDVAEEIMAAGGKALAIETDVSEEASVKLMARVVEDQCGRIDTLINNAGIFSTLEMRPFDQIPLDEWERVLRVNVSMARELGGDGITVNAILPGATFTEIERKTVTPEQKQRIVAMQCIPRPETPEDLVGTALFLASDNAAFVTGQSINLDGGALAAGGWRQTADGTWTNRPVITAHAHKG